MRAALLAVFALIAAPAGAQGPTPEQGRIWKGTIGEEAVTACFSVSYDSVGIYYRDAALEPVRLMQADGHELQVLREVAGSGDEPAAVWSLQSPAGDRLDGEWQKGETALPIRLNAVPAELTEYGTACESAPFLDPLLAGGTTTEAEASFEGTAYTTLAYKGPQRAGLGEYETMTFALDPAQPGDAAINRALAAALPDGTAAHPMGQCVGMALGGGMGGYASDTLEPTVIAPRWLGVRQSGSSYCGGAHPNHYMGLAVHDRKTGAEVDPSAWFKPGALMFYEWEPEPGTVRPIAGLSPALTKALLAQFPPSDEDNECGAIVGEGVSWDIGLTREGPVFVPQLPHVIFACTEEVVLPWKAARQFLSKEGRSVMAGVR